MLAGSVIALPGGKELTRSSSVCASLRIVCGGPSLTGNGCALSRIPLLMKVSFHIVE